MKRHLPLILILAASSLLRLAIVAQGGQLYWPDERLYVRVVDAFHDAHSWKERFDAVIGSEYYLGFSIVSAVPAAVQVSVARARHVSSDALYKAPALFLSQLSVLSLLLLHAIARRSGASRHEAIVATALMAAAASMFYYSRHLLPYDAAMALALTALWIGLGPASGMRSIACGALAAAAFITYNGYWLLAGVAMLITLARELPSWRRIAARTVLVGAGFVAVSLLVMIVQRLANVPSLLSGMQRLAGTISDGFAPEGFSLPWAYLWHAEHGLLIGWLATAAAILVPSAVADDRRHSAVTWAAAALFVYLGIAITSAVLHVFVAMGRQSRQVVPFLCLAAAPVVVQLFQRLRRREMWATVCAALLLIQAGYNMRTPMLQRFPRDLVNELRSRNYEPLRFAVTLEGPSADAGAPGARWIAVNMQHLYPPRAPGHLPGGTTILRFPHPLEYLPYQYEGFDPVERQVLRSTDISMRLLDASGGH